MDLPTTGPLLRPSLLAAGWTDDELRRLRRTGDLTAITGGAYVESSDPRLRRREAKHAPLVAAAVPRVAPDSVISHVSAAGVAVTSVVRTLLDLARTVGFEQAVVIADAALHRHLCTRDDLAAGLVRMTRWRGAPAARRVVAFADPGR